MLSDEEKQAIEGLKGSQKWVRQQIRLGNLPHYNQGHYADIQIILSLIEKQQKEIEELKEDRKSYAEEYIHNNPWLYKQLNENYMLRSEAENINKNWEDKIIAKVTQIKNRPVKDEFITATQGKLNTIIDIESLLF